MSADGDAWRTKMSVVRAISARAEKAHDEADWMDFGDLFDAAKVVCQFAEDQAWADVSAGRWPERTPEIERAHATIFEGCPPFEQPL